MSDDSTVSTDDIELGGSLDVEWVPRLALEPNEYNPSQSDGTNREVLKKSIVDNSWTQPLLVQPDGTIINGESRWFVARHPDIQEEESLTPDGIDAGYVPVYVLDGGKKQAMAATYQHNAATGSHDKEAVAELVRETEDIEWALDRLEMEESELEVLEETGEDISDVDFENDTDRGAYTETVEYDVSQTDQLEDICGSIDAQTLVKLARFIVETGLHEEVDAPDPDWSDVPDV